MVALLDVVDTGLNFLVGEVVAYLAGVGDIQQRAAHPVVADLDRAFAPIRHMAVCARHSAARMDALAPHLEFRMLRLERLGPGLGMFPVEEPVAVGELVVVVGGLDLVHRQPVVPRVEKRRLGAAVVFDVALAAHEGTHLLARCGSVRVVGFCSVAGAPSSDRRQVRDGGRGNGERADAVEKARAGDAQLHRLRIVAVDARDRVLHQPGCRFVRHGAYFLESSLQLVIAVRAHQCIGQRTGRSRLEPCAAVRHDVRSVALDAGAGLAKGQLYAAGLALICKHVLMAAPRAIVDRKGVPGENRLQAGVLHQLVDGHRSRPPSAVGCARPLGGAPIAVVLAREIPAPLGGIRNLFGQVDKFEYHLPRFLLAGGDAVVKEQDRDGRRRACQNQGCIKKYLLHVRPTFSGWVRGQRRHGTGRS